MNLHNLYPNMENTYDKIIFYVLITLVAILFLLLIMFIIYFLINIFRIRNFCKKYSIKKLPKSIKIKHQKKKDKNYYILKYPYWSVSKKDGTADLRIKYNNIIWQDSILYIDSKILLSKRPDDLLYVVQMLRKQNIKIELSREEKIKYEKIYKKKKAFSNSNDIGFIIDYYSQNPTKFENLCARLFENMGYTSKLTPPTNDGGYDILISRDNATAIVECKCYSIEHKVGRPTVQKLVGANIVSADKMILITTSDYSSSAISYANNVGVILINGKNLMKLLNTYMSFERSDFEISISECQLKIPDMYAYVPRDIYELYFEFQ